MEDLNKLLKYTNNCILSKLSEDYYGNDIRPEFHLRNNKLKENFQRLIDLLENEDLTQNSEIVFNALSYLLILYCELQSTGPWNTDDTKAMEKSELLNEKFHRKYNINLCEVLKSDHFESQIIFDICIRELHKNINSHNLKKHPSLIDVYYLLVMNIKDYKINIIPAKVLPLALLLMDDYVTSNKIKGLQCSTAILKCLNTEDFIMGNFYDVVYSSLKKNILEKDQGVTIALFECFMEFLKIVPSDIKKNKLDDLFSNVIEQIYTESNLYRKVVCFNFVTKIIQLNGIHCVKKRIFKTIIRDNLDSCSNESVSEILLEHVLECLLVWVKYCWCTWMLSEGHKMLSSLFKILYLSKDETIRLKVQNIIITLIKLCAEDEQTDILENLQEPLKCSNQGFLNSLEIIKQEINS